jgi:hypothetical protein
MSSSTRLTGDDPDERFLTEMGLSTLEIARVAEIKARKNRKPRTGFDVVPRRFSEYKSYHKRMYAEVFGDAAAEAVFGRGPWLKAEQSRMSFERQIERGLRKRPSGETARDGICKT